MFPSVKILEVGDGECNSDHKNEQDDSSVQYELSADFKKVSDIWELEFEEPIGFFGIAP